MRQNIHIIYQDTLEKYRKFKTRYVSGIKTGRFYKYSSKKQQEIVNRLDHLVKRVNFLKAQLKLAVAAGAVSLCLGVNTSIAQELGPFVENNEANPFFSTFIFDDQIKTSFGDLDNDGDLDMILGNEVGYIRYFENLGTANSPRFFERTDAQNPFNGIVAENGQAAPRLIDFDGDGDLDLIMGERGSYESWDVRYFQNSDADDSTIGDNPNFTELTGSSSPIENVNGQYRDVIPTIADIDDDGDLDILLGNDKGYSTSNRSGDAFSLWLNDEGFSTEESSYLPGLPTYFYGDQHKAPTFHDFDGDGDFDLFLGTSGGTIRFFENDDIDEDNGDEEIEGATFTEQTGVNNPFDGIDVGSDAVVSFGDLDGDGDDDAIIGSNYNVNFFKNESGSFVQQLGRSNPFDGFQIGYYSYNSAPTFVDLDDDGDMEAVIGGKYSSYTNGFIIAFEKSGSNFIEDTSSDNPFNSFPIYARPAPSFAQIDADADFDLFLGTNNGIAFLDNNGTVNDPSFDFPADYSIIVPNYTSYVNDFRVSFSDVDEDGDLEAVSGREDYAGDNNIEYFNNNGANQFAIDEVNNPFSSLSLIRPQPRFVDIDHNGQDDLFIGLGNGTVAFFPKLGPENFDISMTPSDNPLNGIDVGSNAIIDFTDFDNDGDLDAFIGSFSGTIDLIENQNIAPEITLGTTSALTFTEGDPALLLDTSLELTDVTNDDIISATIQIINFAEGEDQLDFTTQTGITGSFDDTNGTLTLSGTATANDYQDVLRSVTYFNNSSNPSDETRTIEITVRDFDNTNPIVATIDINIISISSEPPQVDTTPATTQVGSTVTIDLCDIISDPDNSFEELFIEVISIESGATTLIEGCNLIVDYQGIDFEGQDNIFLRATDPDGNVDENSLTITVESSAGDIQIFNAVSPNGDGLNDFWEIVNLQSPNVILLYNRWGDEVKSLNNVEVNVNNRTQIDLSDLPAATYFYKISSPQGSFEGYIVLKN